MIFVKLRLLLAMYSFFARATPTVEVSRVYHDHRTTKYLWQSEEQHLELPQQQQQHGHERPAGNPVFYITPVATPVTNFPTTPLRKMKVTPVRTVITTPPNPFLNKLSNSFDDDADDVESDPSPLNPVPMLKPNPFVSSGGTKIQFVSKPGNGAPQRREEGAFCRRSFDGRSGYCILASHCLHVIREYRMHGTRIDVCTYRRNIPVLCCPLADKQRDVQRVSAKSKANNGQCDRSFGDNARDLCSSISECREYYNGIKDVRVDLSDGFSGKFCVESVPFVVGGEITKSGEYPHVVAVGWTRNDNQTQWGCGGTLISDFFVLTAAHCATSGGKPPDIVRLGSKSLLHASSDQQDIKILIIILHPKYSFSSYYHDIALLKLSKRVRFSQLVQPACLWQSPRLDISNAVAVGWGRTQFLGPKSNDLRKVNLNLINQKTCRDIYRKERRLPLGLVDEQFCAGSLEGGKDTCQGDSGGPLLVELPEFNCVKFIVGITSFGKFCAQSNAPGVYTKIYSYLDWIEKIVFRI